MSRRFSTVAFAHHYLERIAPHTARHLSCLVKSLRNGTVVRRSTLTATLQCVEHTLLQELFSPLLCERLRREIYHLFDQSIVRQYFGTVQ